MSLLQPPNSRISADAQFDTLMLSTSDRIPVINVTAAGAAPAIRGQIAFDSLTSNVYFANGTIWQIMGTGTILAGDVTGPSNANTVVAIRGTPVSAVVPTTGNLLMYSGTQWVPVGGTPVAGQIPIATSPSVFAWGNTPSVTQRSVTFTDADVTTTWVNVSGSVTYRVTRLLTTTGTKMTALTLIVDAASGGAATITVPVGNASAMLLADLPTGPAAVPFYGAVDGVGGAISASFNADTSITIGFLTNVGVTQYTCSSTYMN